MYRILKTATLTTIFLILVGCSSDNLQKPAPLAGFKSTLDVEKVWSHHTRAGRADLAYTTLQIGYDDKKVYIVSPHGKVFAFDAKSGKEIWQENANIAISSGVSVGQHLAIVTGSQGTVYAFNTDDGHLVWQQNIAEQTLGLAAISETQVIIKTITDNVFALAVNDGHVLWAYAANAPSLILRGGSTPQLAGKHVIVGLANGKIISLTTQQGNLDWQQVVANPQGIFPVQRMVDLVASPLIDNDMIYDASYQGSLAALELKNGQVVWNHKLSTFTGLALAGKALYVTDADSTILSFQTDDGGVNWKQTVLSARMITAPALLDDYLVVGDAQGYVHWFNQKTGTYAARRHLSWEPIRSAPIVLNNIIYVLDTRGYIAAYQIHPRAA